MSQSDLKAELLLAVKHLLEIKFIDTPERLLPAVRDPIPVQEPGGRIYSWIVPLTSGARLLGWAQFSSALDFLRYSTVSSGHSTGNEPNLRDWFDPTTIAARVKLYVGHGLQTSSPILTFDRDPSRLVWLVVGTDPAHKGKLWYVAGNSIWEATANNEEVTGGSAK